MPVLDKDGKPVLELDENGSSKGKTVSVGYTPGKEYSAKVRLCNVKKDADGNDIYYCSAYKTTPKVMLKESTQPLVHIEYNRNENAINVTSDVCVTGELYINSGTDNEEWYNFMEKNTRFSQPVALPDGEYTVEFHAKDDDGDSAIVCEIINIDTTAPVIMLASPVSGSSFSGDSIIVTATAEKDAEYSFRINGIAVSPAESDIFTGEAMKCTLPLGDAKQLAKINLEIIARDKAGNETLKFLTLTNKAVSEISAISVQSSDKPVSDGKIVLGEGESTYLKVYGLLQNGDKIDVTDMNATSLEIMGGTSAGVDGTKVTSGFAGQTLIRAGFALGGGEYLYDGMVIETTDKTLIYSALEETLSEAKKITKNGYTNESWNSLQKAIRGAEEIMSLEGVTQSDIDKAATAVSNAIAALKRNSSSSSGGGTAAYYIVSFNTNSGNVIASQKIKSGQKVTEPNTPVKDGFVFDGWYTDKRLTMPYDFNNEVLGSFTLYAKWVEKENDTVKWENPFADVCEDDWFYDAARYTHKNGLINGVSDTEFAPNSDITRAMFVTILYRSANEPAAENSAFTDVEKDSYYEKAVAWASANAIVSGVSEDRFEPNEPITREQMAAIIYRFAAYKGYDTGANGSAAYEDNGEISDYAKEAVIWTSEKSIMKGNPDGTFAPKANTTRAQVAAVFMRIFENLK